MRKSKDRFSLSAPLRVPNPQDPYQSRDDQTRTPLNIIRISHSDSKQKALLKNKKQETRITTSLESIPMLTSRSENPRIHQKNPKKIDFSQTLENHRFQSNERIKTRIDDQDYSEELEKIIDAFFSKLNNRGFNTEIEQFLTTNIKCNNAIYWEEIPSLRRLYSSKYQISFDHDETIVGSAFYNSNIQTCQVCGQHQKWNAKNDSKIVSDRGPIILFQLRDFDGSISGIVEIQKKFAEPEMTVRDKQFFTILQQKYTLFSRFFNEQPFHKQIIDMGKIMTVEQFLAVFSMKMIELFNCKESELWDFSDELNPVLYRSTIRIEMRSQETGIAGYVFSKGQLYNAFSCKIESSYISTIDGNADQPILGIPRENIVIMLRGCMHKPVFTQSDENRLNILAPYIVSFYNNALAYSQKPNAQPGLDLLQGISGFLPVYNKKRALNGMLEEAMIEIQKMTSSDRVTFFKIHDGILESVFFTGMRDVIKLKIGEGIAGHVALTGVEENVCNATDSMHFQGKIDTSTGYQTKSMLTVPIISTEGTVKGVIQLINKIDGMPFTRRDSLVATVYGSLCIFMILNSNFLEENTNLKKRIEMISKSNPSLDDIGRSLNGLCKTARIILNAKAVTAFIFDDAKGSIEKAGSDGIYNSVYNGKGTLNYCLTNNKSLIINDTFHEALVDEVGDKGKRNILTVPINAHGVQIGALEAVNKHGIFDEIDLFTLTCISNIISNSITSKSMMNVIEHGKSQLVISHFITKDEIGKCLVPASFKGKVNVNPVKFASYELQKNDLTAVVFEIFDKLGILKPIKCDSLFAFITSIENSYTAAPYHSWVKAVSITQLVFLVISSLKEVFNYEEKLALIIASMLAFAGHDGTDDSYHTRLDTVEAVAAGTTPVHDHMTTTKALHILGKNSSKIFPEDRVLIIKKQIISLLVSKSSINSYVDELAEINEQHQFDINCIRHREVFLKCLFNMALYDEFGRSDEICDKWEYIYSLERFSLGAKESDAQLTYSSRHNCKELYNKNKCINERIQEKKKLFEATCLAMEKESDILSGILGVFKMNEKFFIENQK